MTLCISTSLLHGQADTPAYKFINLGTAQKLSNLSVGGFYQDKYGFVWVSTNFGLNSYDGQEFISFLAVPGDSTSLSSSNLSGCNPYEDPTGSLWIATSLGGLNQYDYTTGKFRQYKADAGRPDWLASNQIVHITGDGTKGLWIATLGKGLNYYDYESGAFRLYYAKEDSPENLMGGNTIPSLMQDSRGRLWIGTTRGASVFDGQDFTRYRPDARQPRSLSSVFVSGLYEDRSGRVWIGTDNGLNLWNEEGKDFTRFFPSEYLHINGKGYDYIWEILQDSEGILWLGTNTGLLRFDPERRRFDPYLHNPSDPNSILPGPVHALMEDHEKNLWIGTRQGISILNKASARFNRPEVQSLQASFGQITLARGIIACLEAQDNLWLATQKGLYTCRYGEAPQMILAGDFSALFYDDKGIIYAGTINQGFYRIFPDGKIIHTETFACLDSANIQIKPARINAFAEDRRGHIWVGILGGLWQFDASVSKCRKYFFSSTDQSSISSNEIRALLTDADGNLWITTNDGVNKLSTAELAKPWGSPLHFERFNHQRDNANSLSSNATFPILEDNKRNIWVGTDVGLNRYEPSIGKWTRFYTADGLPQDRITNIQEDRKGRLWITTYDGGVACFEPGSECFRNFFLEDGLNSRSYESFNVLVNHSGLILLAGTQGVNLFDPEEVLRPPTADTGFRFTRFQIFNKDAPIGVEAGMLPQPIFMAPNIVLNHTHKVFSVEFSTFNFIHSGKKIYRYRLTNLGKDWIYIGKEPKITFANLRPGRYVLEVEFSDNQKDWITPEATLHFRILPPWYWAWWSKSLYLLLLAGLLYAFYRFQLKRRLAQAETLRLRELDGVKTRLYTNITHEFRTPLTVILGMADKIEEAPRQWLGEGVKTIRRNGRNLLRLVNQMLDLARLEGGALPLTMIQGDINAHLKTMMEMYRSYADAKNIAMEFVAEPEHLVMDYDPDKTGDIVSNLLSNALKFTPAGGKVVVSSRRSAQSVAPHRIPHTAHCLLTVQDTGSGIAPEKLPCIFDRFYQADDSATRRGEGTGIGLALTHELVKLLGGSIEAQSEQGQGATFIVRLPVGNEAPLQEVPPALKSVVIEMPAPQPAPSGRTQGEVPLALIVEDNADVTRLLMANLKDRYRIETASNGREGVEKALELLPDVVISDVMMPEMDGFELCRTLKGNLRSSHIPIILLTARADVDSRIEGLEMGADAYLAKPFNQQELEVSLRKSLELRERLRQRYAGAELSPPPVEAFRREDAFVQQLRELIAQHYADDRFNVEALAKCLAMSETQLRRKTKALLDEMPKDILRAYRMEKAYDLLQQGELNVSEVAYATGFVDVAHFSNTFYQAYGIRPGAVRGR